MTRTLVAFACLLSGTLLWATESSELPSFEYDTARKHEIKPHRRTIPIEGVRGGFNQLRLTLTVSATGDVLTADAGGDAESLAKWPELEAEVHQWKFAPFENKGKAVTAEIEEYIDLVPPERFPQKHVQAPVLRTDSTVAIALSRSGCYGTCPAYTVTVSTTGIIFQGDGYVVAKGRHTGPVVANDVRQLAQKFIAADFYSMDDSYEASVTDNPEYSLSISIDGHTKKVEDYVGSWVGMPAIIKGLEEEVDSFANTQRWIAGGDGLVDALQAEKFNFKTYDAQVMLKEASSRGESETVQGLLEAGVPLKPYRAPKRKEDYMVISFKHVDWLTAASSHPDTLQALMDAAASKNDQKDKDLALGGAACSGDVDVVRALIAYGANPNVDLSKLTVTENSGAMTTESQGAGSILIDAAKSGNPEMVREILRYNPKLELRDSEGKTALFAAAEHFYAGNDDGRAECVRLLAEAGADINARDEDGSTPLHETYLTNVEEQLLKLGADINARNDSGETPIFTTVDDDAIPLFIEHGADLTIRNEKGQTVVEAAKDKGPKRQEALRKAIQKLNER